MGLALLLSVVLPLILAGGLAGQQPTPDAAAPDTIPGDTTRIDPLRDMAVDMTGDELAADPFENSWPLFGSGARMAIRGYVKLDMIADFDGAYDRFQFPIAAVPVAGDGRPRQGGYFNMFARESRFSIDIRSVTEDGKPLQVFVEVDFWQNADPAFFTPPRLRHFYGVRGSLLAGRTWGTLTDVYSLPTTIDFAVGDAISGARRPQVRWEPGLPGGLNLAVALEMLEFVEIDNVDEVPGQANQTLPLFVARVTRPLGEKGRLMVGGTLGQLRWDGMEDGPDAAETFWGLQFSGRFGLTQETTLIWQVSGGDGWGSNIATNIGAGSGAVLTADGTLTSLASFNVSAGVSRYFSEILQGNASLAFARTEDSPLRPDDRLREGGTVHLNLVWSPVKSVNTGIEYMYGLRRNVDGADGSAHRMQAMMKYKF